MRATFQPLQLQARVTAASSSGSGAASRQRLTVTRQQLQRQAWRRSGVVDGAGDTVTDTESSSDVESGEGFHVLDMQPHLPHHPCIHCLHGPSPPVLLFLSTTSLVLTMRPACHVFVPPGLLLQR